MGPEVDVRMSVRTSVHLSVRFGDQSQESTEKYEVEDHRDASSYILNDEAIIKTVLLGRWARVDCRDLSGNEDSWPTDASV
jgi:hypothetical protein